MKSNKLISILLIFVALLLACNLVSPTDFSPIATTAQTSSTPVPPTDIPSVIPTLHLTDTALAPTPASTPLPFMTLDGLRVAYIIDGNLYVQDSGKEAIQLTHSGQDRRPVFSDDGQKIVFFREWKSEMNQLYVINSDRTGERILVSPELLSEHYEFTEPHSVAFVPGTHLLLFNTHYYRPQYPKTAGLRPDPTNDLLVVNTDTGEIKRLAAIGQGGFFLVSPNGKWIAVQTPDHVNVIDLQGRYVLNNLFTHSPDDYDCVYYGYICAPMYWTQDSTVLILVQPIPRSERPANGNHPLARTVWRYPLDGRLGKEARLIPAGPMGEALSVSPDGNWIAFSLFEQGDQDGVYLGNLSDGTSKLIYQPKLNEMTGVRDPAPLDYYGWSPDSVNFVFSDDNDNKFISNVNGETTLLGRTGVLGWIDNRHYFSGSTLYEIGGQDGVLVMDFPSFTGRFEPPMAFVFLGH